MARARAIATRCCWPPESSAGIASALSASADPLEQLARRAARRRPRLRPRTLIGPSVTLPSAVLCENRLKLWNTMPMSARRRASALPSAGSRLRRRP